MYSITILAFNLQCFSLFKKEAFADFIRKKQKDESNGFAMSSVKGSLIEIIKLVGNQVDMH